MLREKLALIYEYNEDSPLFLRAAEYQLEKNDTTKAIQIITKGIKKFPDYSTAYLALGKVLLLIRNYDAAEKAFIKGCNLINDHQTLEYYLNELEKQRAIEGYFAKSRRTSFLSDEVNEVLDNDIVKPNRTKNIHETKEQKEKVTSKVDERLDDIAKEISAAKITVQQQDDLTAIEIQPEEVETLKEESVKSELVSETMAKIYLSQGKFQEAVDVYQALIPRFPERKNEFLNIIREIKEQLTGW